MTYRVYLAAARFNDDAPQSDDLPVERVFVNAGAVREVWVETESVALPAVGRAASFALPRPMDIGFSRITGTIERKVRK